MHPSLCVQPLRSAPFGVLALTHATRLPKCNWMADAAEVIECKKTETCEIATSTDLLEPTSAVRHACHPVVMASLACNSISCWLTLLAALGACASITVQMYAGRKQWSVEGVHIYLSYVKVLAEGQFDAKTGIADGI